MSDTPAQTPGGTDSAYPLSTQLNISFSPYEDRLVLKSKDSQHHASVLLLSRRMVMIVLQQLLSRLPGLSGLDKTPAQYWQEVLQMAHQQAMQAKAMSVQTASASSSRSGSDIQKDNETPKPRAIFLATELTVRLESKRLILAFKGLPMPRAMTVASAPEPVFALSLQPGHAHQLIELLITKAQEAVWHLPLELPWLENPKAPGTSLQTSSLH